MSFTQDEAAVEAALAKTKLSTGGALPEPPPMGQAMLPMGTYAGKVVAITGGGGGLGRGFAREFARLGATVAILSRGEAHMARGKAVVEEVGGRAVTAKMDVRNPAEITAAFDKIEHEAGADGKSGAGPRPTSVRPTPVISRELPWSWRVRIGSKGARASGAPSRLSEIS